MPVFRLSTTELSSSEKSAKIYISWTYMDYCGETNKHFIDDIYQLDVLFPGVNWN